MISEEQNGHGTLDQRVAAALANEQIDRDLLVALHDEANEAIRSAQCTVETETERALDLSNADPDASDLAITRAKRVIARLQKAIPLLAERIKAIDTAEYAKAWGVEYEELFTKDVDAAASLQITYTELAKKLIITYALIDCLKAKIMALNLRAPPGEFRRLRDPELVARGLDHFDAECPPLREKLRLPYWGTSREVEFPPDPMAEINRTVALNNAAMLRALEAKGAGAFGPDWWQAKHLQDQERLAEIEKREAQEKAQQAESLEAFNKSLLEAEARRRMGIAK